jgi:hypothetical protein
MGFPGACETGGERDQDAGIEEVNGLVCFIEERANFFGTDGTADGYDGNALFELDAVMWRLGG